MMRVCRFTVVLVLLVVENFQISVSLLPVEPNSSGECLEELGMKYSYGYESSELTYNRTCFTKCTYEKDGKLDSDGNFVISEFPTQSSDAIAECLNLIKTTDICKKVSLLDTCVMRKTDPYWKRYDKCQQFVSYNDEFNELTAHCYQRCQMIVDGSLDEDGKANISNIMRYNPNNTITNEEAVEKCEKIVTDEDSCLRDLNMYHCVTYLVYHWSASMIEQEIECAKENNVYPFFGVQSFDTPRQCYERCTLIKMGSLDEVDIKKSANFKTLNMSEAQIEEAFNTCKMTMHNTDKCIEDLYFYDCINYLHYADAAYLKKQTECALETNATLVSYRQQYQQNYCNTRCLMIKDGQMDSTGAINKTYLLNFSNNQTIIDEVVDECNGNNKMGTCGDDINAYNCASAKVTEKVYTLCENEMRNNNPNDEGSFCYSRCLMTHSGQLTPEGDVIVESFKHMNKNDTIIENALKSCKAKMVDEHECARIVHNYHCVNSEIWNLSTDRRNVVFPHNVAF